MFLLQNKPISYKYLHIFPCIFMYLLVQYCYFVYFTNRCDTTHLRYAKDIIE